MLAKVCEKARQENHNNYVHQHILKNIIDYDLEFCKRGRSNMITILDGIGNEYLNSGITIC